MTVSDYFAAQRMCRTYDRDHLGVCHGLMHEVQICDTSGVVHIDDIRAVCDLLPGSERAVIRAIASSIGADHLIQAGDEMACSRASCRRDGTTGDQQAGPGDVTSLY